MADTKVNSGKPDITRSNELLARAEGLIPSLTQTLAKGPTQHIRGFAPVYLRRGEGCHVWDVDDNCFIDMTMGVGPLSLGYRDPDVDAAIRAQLEDGIAYSLMHPLEVEVAELVRDVVPGAEMVRYSKTGADVTSAAVRAARAYTGREKVLCCGYHGWHDWYVSATGRTAGVPEGVQALVHTFNYNDIESVRRSLDDDTACVILEPMVFEEPKPGFLAELKSLCHERGALLVFDEMWTGFRVALGGAQERFDVRADMATFSKAVANGMPISLLTGRAEVMKVLESDVFFYTTFGGEALSLAATKATIEKLRREDVPAVIERRGAALKSEVKAILEGLGASYVDCVGLPCRTMLSFSEHGGQQPLVMKSFVQQELLRRGVLWSGFHNMSFAHADADVDTVVGAYREVLPALHEAVQEGAVAERLEGQALAPVFRKTDSFDTKPKAR